MKIARRKRNNLFTICDEGDMLQPHKM